MQISHHHHHHLYYCNLLYIISNQKKRKRKRLSDFVIVTILRESSFSEGKILQIWEISHNQKFSKLRNKQYWTLIGCLQNNSDNSKLTEETLLNKDFSIVCLIKKNSKKCMQKLSGPCLFNMSLIKNICLWIHLTVNK